MPRHAAASSRRRSIQAAALSGVLVLGLVVVHLISTGRSSPAQALSSALPAARSSATSTGSPTTRSTTDAARDKAAASEEAAKAAKAAAAKDVAVDERQQSALRKLDALVAERPHSYTSVAVYDYGTRKLITAGAKSGMTSASVAKVQLLESLLLQHQQHKTKLSSYDRSLLTRMIEHSDNEAANSVFAVIGGRSAVLRLQPKLGLNSSVHHLGSSNLWGLTKTDAAEEVVLLKNLASTASPLTAANRRYARSLMRHVESDQRWGVPVVADKGTSADVKNGWLAVSSDGNRWAVNSIGLVTVHKHLLAIAIMTQHGSSYSGGITRVQALARAAARAATA